jgi:hypothetical protein
MFTSTYSESFQAQLDEYLNQINTIPDNIFLIWIGDDIPDTATRPYQNNAIIHKKLNPSAKVQILVSKAMLVKSGRWDALLKKFSEHGVILRDIHTTCSHMINFSVIEKLMLDKNDYVWASELLRLGLIFHEGGWYFDTDITPFASLGNSNPHFGFLQFHDFKQILTSGFCFQAAVKGHFIYLFASVISRHFYEMAARDNPEFLKTKFASVRQATIGNLSGFPITNLLKRTNLSDTYEKNKSLISYPLREKCNVSSDCSWLDSYKLLDEYKVVSELALLQKGKKSTLDLNTILSLSVRLKQERAKLETFHSAILEELNETYIKELCGQYFPAMIKEFDSSRSYFNSLNRVLAADFPFTLSAASLFWTKSLPLSEVTKSNLEALESQKLMMIYSI